MAKNFYAVKRGYDKKQDIEVRDLIFTDWYDVAPLVKNNSNARYKGFDTEEEARVWLSVVDKVDAEKRSKDSIEKTKEELGIENDISNSSKTNPKLSLNIEEIERLKEEGYSKFEVFYYLTRSLEGYLDKVYGK